MAHRVLVRVRSPAKPLIPLFHGQPGARAWKRIERDLVCLPISDVPSQWARNPKRVSAPFPSDYGEFALHYSYNYPEMLKIVD